LNHQATAKFENNNPVVMKSLTYLIFTLLVFAGTIGINAQPRHELKAVIDSVIVQAKTHAVNTSTVNWDSVRSDMYREATYALSVNDLGPAFQVMLVALNDRQGELYNSTTQTMIAVYPDETTLGEHTSGTTFDCRLMKNDVRYLRIPSGNMDVHNQAQMIRDAINPLIQNEQGNWIIDLRYTTGGQLHAMLAGMAPVLGEGLLTTVVDGKKKIRDLYSAHNGKFYKNHSLMINLPSYPKDLKASRIAVLTSEYTSGAAEIVALILKGRKNTKFFGQPTAGKIPVTTSIHINQHLVMKLTHIKYLDRNGDAYSQHIEPDATVAFEDISNLDQHKTIDDAVLWLTANDITVNVPELAVK
jgi:carboxyl-terminal processing protease